MKTLIIYDDNGQVFSQLTNGYLIPQGGVQYLEVEIPQGKRIKIIDGIGVDVTSTPHQAVFEDIPPTETELLKQRLEEQEVALIELASIIGGAN